MLVEHDPIFAALENEKRLGWESTDVERLWKLRTEKLNVLNEGSKKNRESKRVPQLNENPFGALVESGDDEDPDGDEGKNLSVTGQKLIRAGKGPSYDKYYEFYKKLFSSASEHSDIFTAGRPKRFMDIGCAPGGLCAYFIRDLGWSGVGFTLQLERGGLKVRFKDPKLSVAHCDMSDMGSVEFINSTTTLNSESEAAKFDFVNCGVVMGKHQVESIGEDRETALQILRVNRNQFLVALNWLADGGDLFWVFQSSSIGCWFYFLKKLQSVFRKISLHSTLVPSRSPVYAICAGFDSLKAREWIRELETASELTDHHIEAWNVKTWTEAGPLIESMRDDLHKIWNTQKEGLREIRESAHQKWSSSEEKLLKKLSGTASTGSSGGSFRKLLPEVARDDGWRRAATSSSSSFQRKAGRADEADSWRV